MINLLKFYFRELQSFNLICRPSGHYLEKEVLGSSIFDLGGWTCFKVTGQHFGWAG